MGATGVSDRRNGEAGVGEAAGIGMHEVNEVAAVAEVRVFECLVRLHDGRAGQALALSGGEYLQAGLVVEPCLKYGFKLFAALGAVVCGAVARVVYEVCAVDHAGELGPHARAERQEAYIAVLAAE